MVASVYEEGTATKQKGKRKKLTIKIHPAQHLIASVLATFPRVQSDKHEHEYARMHGDASTAPQK